jgi:quercetin dioxygenase-like cupin family protein
MAIPHAQPGIPVDLRVVEGWSSETQTTALVKNDAFEAIRLVARKGTEVCHNHQVEGMITVHCLEGRIEFTADGDRREMGAGHWLYLTGGVPHTITALEDSLVLLTVMFP